MVETIVIKKIGNSLGILFDKTVIEKVYGLTEGSELEVEYAVPIITIKPKSVGAVA